LVTSGIRKKGGLVVLETLEKSQQGTDEKKQIAKEEFGENILHDVGGGFETGGGLLSAGE